MRTQKINQEGVLPLTPVVEAQEATIEWVTQQLPAERSPTPFRNDSKYSPDQVTLLGKLADIMESVPYIQKTGKAQYKGSSYTYASQNDLLMAIRSEFVKRKVAFVPVDILDFQRTPSSSNTGSLIDMMVLWEFTDLSTGASIQIKMPGSGWDSLEKGTYKALTGSQKYALSKLLMIITGDDPEKDDFSDASARMQNAKRDVDRSKDIPAGVTKVEGTPSPDLTAEDMRPWDESEPEDPFSLKSDFDPEDLNDIEPDWWRNEPYSSCSEIEKVVPGGTVGSMSLGQFMHLLNEYVPLVDNHREGYVGSKHKRLVRAARERLKVALASGAVTEKRQRQTGGIEKVRYYIAAKKPKDSN